MLQENLLTTDFTPLMMNSYGLSTLETDLRKLFPGIKMIFKNLTNKIYIKINYKNATVHVSHYKYGGGTDFDYECYGIVDYSEFDFINPICIGSVNKVIESMYNHVVKYLKRF